MTANDRLQSLADRLKPSAQPPSAQPPSARLRSGPEKANVRVLAVIAVIAALVAGGYLWLARPRPDPAPSTADAAATEVPAGAPSPASPSGPSPGAVPAGAANPAAVVVHVLGKVKHPGVVTLPSGSRVEEAIKAAGGVRPGAGTGTLNLARKLVDGEQIPVGVRLPSPAPRMPPPGQPPPGQPPPGSAAPGTPVDLNAATAEQLDQLPGVGPVLAQRIVDYRTQHGGFRSVDQLQDVDGIGARRFADLRPMVRV